MLEALVTVSDNYQPYRSLERLDLLIRSLNLFWKGEKSLRLHVAFPDDETLAISTWLQLYKDLPNLDLNLITESQISPVLNSVRPGYGGMKQMLIKLAAFDFVEADHCLLLDTDVVACKPFSEFDLIIDGRSRTEWLQPTLYAWWFESARVLGYEVSSNELHRPRFFVTPQILSRHIVLPLRKALTAKGGGNWLMRLIGEYSNNHPNIWTEYTLYDLFSERQKLRATYHLGPDEMPEGSLHCMAQSIWAADDFPAWDPIRALDGRDPGFFMVLQSITAEQVDFDIIRAKWTSAVQALYPDYHA